MSINKITNSDRKKRGFIFLAIAAVCMLLSVILPQSNTLGSQAAVIMVSFIRTVASLGLLVFLVMGLYYVITGYTKKA